MREALCVCVGRGSMEVRKGAGCGGCPELITGYQVDDVTGPRMRGWRRSCATLDTRGRMTGQRRGQSDGGVAVGRPGETGRTGDSWQTITFQDRYPRISQCHRDGLLLMCMLALHDA